MISQDEYVARRQRLACALPEKGVALIPAASEVLRNGDAHYRFRQQSDFYYLTGFHEPDALLLIYAGASGESVLFNRPRDPQQEQWTGVRLGQEGAVTQLGMHAAYPYESIDTRLPELLAEQPVIFYSLGRDALWDQRVLHSYHLAQKKRARARVLPEIFWDISPFLSELRLIKSSAEIACMRTASRISVAAHQRVMRAAPHAAYEYELEAEFLHELGRVGCRNVAYDSIVASGAHACTLHYTANNQPLIPTDLVLIDAGAEFENYAADITRTYPVKGTFTAEQAQIYELVYHAQRAGIACVKPTSAWNDIQQAIVRVLTQGLVDLNILKGQVDDLIATSAYKPFYMHNSGHWLGLDVHDCGAYQQDGQSRRLEPGMALTVEPGLYLTPGTPGLDPRYWNIGVRIEDDLVVTADGCENLTEALVTRREDLEAYVRG